MSLARRSLLGRGLAVAFVLVMCAACSVSTDTASQDSDDAQPGAVESAASDSNISESSTSDSNASESSTSARILELMARTPDPTGELTYISFTDLELGVTQSGGEWPNRCTSDAAIDGFIDQFAALTLDGAATVPALVRDNVYDPEPLRTAFGVEICDIVAAGDAAEQGADGIFFVTTPAESIDAAVRLDPDWSGDLTSENIGQVTVYDWGEDLSIQRTSPVRRLGIGGQLMVSGSGTVDSSGVDGTIVVKSDRREILDTYLNNTGDGLLDRRFVRDITTTMLDRGAFHIVLSDAAYVAPPFDLLEDDPASAIEEAADATRLVRWQTLGLGSVIRDSGAVELVIVLAHTFEDDAVENATRLEAILRENEVYVDRLRLIDTTTDGPYLIATLESTGDVAPIAAARDAIFRRGALFAVE